MRWPIMAMSGPMEWKARAYLSSLTQMRITAGHESLRSEKNLYNAMMAIR